MIKIKITDLEKKLGKKLKRNFTCLGIDTASRSGWAIFQTKDKDATLDFGVISIETKDFYYKYDHLIQLFGDLITRIEEEEEKIVIIEDVFFGKNINTLKILSRIGMIVYVLCFLKHVNKIYLLATQARMRLGFKGNQKKEIIHAEFLKKTQLPIEDIDVVDAVLLAIVGAVETEVIL